jgi:hypothetical protein
MYRNETNITFQRNPPRLQRTGSSVTQVWIPIRVHHYEPESKTQSMAWKRPTSPVATKFRSQPSACKIMLTIFWDMEGVILVHLTPKCETVNSRNYCDVLWTKLKSAI